MTVRSARSRCTPPLPSSRRWLVLSVVLGASPYVGNCVWNPDCTQPPEPPARAADLKILSYNIGNGLKEAPYALRIRDQTYEDYVGERIRAEAPDIVLLQEVLSPTLCAEFEETSADRTCFQWQDRPAPVQRLLGDDYTIACDANQHVECIGVRKEFGSIDSLAPGEFGVDAAETEPLPGSPCSYLKGDCNGRHDDCDEESSISTVLVSTAQRKIRIVHAHPTAIGEKCLEKQVKQSFALVDDLATVVGGDWNFDPTRYTDTIPASIWNDWIGKGRRFHSHDMRRDECRLERTSVGQNASLDRVATDFAEGRCRVLQDPRLEEGFDFEALDGERIDHFAVLCDLYYREERP